MNFNATAIRHGAVVGLVQVVLMLLVYLLDTTLLFNFWMGLSTWVFAFVAMYLGLKGVREQEGGLLSFTRAWGHAYIVVIAMTALVTLFNVVLYNFIDPSLVDLAIKQTLNQIEEVALMFGDGMDLEEMKGVIETSSREAMKPLGLVWAGFWSLLFYIVPTLIMAAIMRRKETFFKA